MLPALPAPRAAAWAQRACCAARRGGRWPQHSWADAADATRRTPGDGCRCRRRCRCRRPQQAAASRAEGAFPRRRRRRRRRSCPPLQGTKKQGISAKKRKNLLAKARKSAEVRAMGRTCAAAPRRGRCSIPGGRRPAREQVAGALFPHRSPPPPRSTCRSPPSKREASAMLYFSTPTAPTPAAHERLAAQPGASSAGASGLRAPAAPAALLALAGFVV